MDSMEILPLSAKLQCLLSGQLLRGLLVESVVRETIVLETLLDCMFSVFTLEIFMFSQKFPKLRVP